MGCKFSKEGRKVFSERKVETCQSGGAQYKQGN